MLELPEWTNAVPEFDPKRRWVPIVCSGAGTHELDLMGIVYEWGEQIYFHPRDVNERRLTTQPERDAGARFRAPGSLNWRCDGGCGRVVRMTHAEASEVFDRAWRVGAPMVDMSLYG